MTAFTWCGALPDWDTLQCSTCGNDRHFHVRATENLQRPVVVHRGQPFWGPDCVMGAWLSEVVCAPCEGQGRISIVWPVETPGPACPPVVEP